MPIVQPETLLPALMKLRKSGKSRKGVSTGFSSVDEFMLLNKKYLMLLTGYPSYGKALALDTVVPSPDGHKTMADLQVGDRVYDKQGKPCNVVAVTPAMYFQKCYRMTFSCGQSVVCDAGHTWVTRDDRARMSAGHQARRDRRPPTSKPWNGTNQQHKRTFPSPKTTEVIAGSLMVGGRINHHVPLAGPVQGKEQMLIVPPYTLGAWLGDGRSDGASITAFDQEVLDRISQDGFVITRQSCNGNYGITCGLLGNLRKLGVLKNKHIPPQYLLATETDRRDLLKGLMDTDGHIAPSGACEFTTIHKHLALQVRQLVASLGFRAQLCEGRATLNGKDCGPKYRVYFNSMGGEIFHLSRKQARSKLSIRVKTRSIVSCEITPSVPVKCIQVDSGDHQYLCTESYIPTHNSEILDALAVNSAILHGWKWLYFSPESDDFSTNLRKLISKKMGKPLSHASEQEIIEATEWANEHFSWIDAGEAMYSMDDVLQETRERIECGYTVDVMVIDPWNELCHAAQKGRDDIYISDMMLKLRKFHRKYNVLSVIVIHPHAVEKNKDGSYPIPHLRNCAGGAMWWNKADYGICVHRKDFTIQGAHVYIQKVKDTTIGYQGHTFLDYEVGSGRFKDQFATSFDLPEPPDAPPF